MCKEREVHRKVYEELKKQKNKGDSSLVKRNGKIAYIPWLYRTHVTTNLSKTSNTSAPVSKPIAGGTKPNSSDPEISMESSAPGDNIPSAHSSCYTYNDQ